MIDINYFAASELCRRSALALKYRRDNNIVDSVNENMLAGEKHQLAYTPQNAFPEMRGTFVHNYININFCIDYIVPNEYACEVKSLRIDENWYKAACIVQCGFYKAMIMSGVNNFQTATFMFEKTNVRHELLVDKNIPYYLQYGMDSYLIETDKPERIVDFFVDKAIASLEWDTAREFDNKFKRHEWPILKNYIQVHKKQLDHLILTA